MYKQTLLILKYNILIVYHLLKSAGVLQGDTLAPFLFVIVVDWIMPNATERLEKVLDFL